MGKPSAHPGFKNLLAEWNRRLAKEGFIDIEVTRRGELDLKRPGGMERYKRADPITRDAKYQYFCLIARYVAKTRFKDETERLILSYYSEGMSQRSIQRKLNIQGHRCKVYSPIYRWLRHWGLK